MRGTDLLDSMELANPAYVEAADSAHGRKKHYARWGVLAACLCFVAAGALVWGRGGLTVSGSAGDCVAADSVMNSDNAVSAEDGPTNGEDGVTIPSMEVILSVPEGIEMDMIGFFIYQGRCYAQYDWVQDGMDLVGEYLGTAIGMIDEWTAEDGYVELAGSVSGDFYAVNGFDPTFLLCMTGGDGLVETYVCNTGITLKYGSELYEDRLHLSGGYTAVEYESRESWYYGKEEMRSLTDLSAAERLLDSLGKAEFMYWPAVTEQAGYTMSSIYDTERYHLYFHMNNGMTVHLRLYEDGYVRFQGMLDVCVQVPEEEYAPFLRLLDG